MRAATEALGPTDEVEAGWLRGAAELVDRGEPERRAARAGAVWLEELAPEARARKASLLSAWVAAAEALRTAIHVHESERGPLVEALFPVWRPPSLRRHAEQASTAEAELRRRLASSYVARRLEELPTRAALRPALDALEAAATAWAAERDRPALSGTEADEVRATLIALAEQTSRTLGRVRRVVQAALADRPDLLEVVFPRRGRTAGTETGEAAAEESLAGPGTPHDAAITLRTETEEDAAGESLAGPGRPHGEARIRRTETKASSAASPRARRRRAPGVDQPETGQDVAAATIGPSRGAPAGPRPAAPGSKAATSPPARHRPEAPGGPPAAAPGSKAATSRPARRRGEAPARHTGAAPSSRHAAEASPAGSRTSRARATTAAPKKRGKAPPGPGARTPRPARRS